jgi:hypothetical protein
MLGSEFVARFAKKGLDAWEAAALELARRDELAPWPAAEVTISDGAHTATIRVMSDVLAVGTAEDHVRLPLTPSMAQNICNLHGWLLPTPWIVYQLYRAAPLKLAPVDLVPTRSVLTQAAEHSRLIDAALEIAGGRSGDGQLACGMKKHVVVSNIYETGKVLIFGWYRPPPAPDVFDDRRPPSTPDRQPIQPKSNLHGDFYVDYSHGIQPVVGACVVDGERMATADLYQHPTLSALVSSEGPLRVVRYPAAVMPAPVPIPIAAAGRAREWTRPRGWPIYPEVPPPTEQAIAEWSRRRRS